MLLVLQSTDLLLLTSAATVARASQSRWNAERKFFTTRLLQQGAWQRGRSGRFAWGTCSAWDARRRISPTVRFNFSSRGTVASGTSSQAISSPDVPDFDGKHGLSQRGTVDKLCSKDATPFPEQIGQLRRYFSRITSHGKSIRRRGLHCGQSWRNIPAKDSSSTCATENRFRFKFAFLPKRPAAPKIAPPNAEQQQATSRLSYENIATIVRGVSFCAG
jgi:hypothetical protein